MDILERIIEAVAQKLISMRLNEEKVDHAHSHKVDTGNPMAGKKSGSSNPRNEEPKKPKSGIEEKPMTYHQAGASAPSIRTGSNRRLVSGVDPQRAKRTPIKPEGGSAGGRGGQEETSSERATKPDKPKGRILGREEATEKLMQMRKNRGS